LGVLYANGAYTAGREVAVLDIRGDANIFGLTVSHPLARSLSYSADLDFRLSHNDLENEILGLPLSRDKYTAAALGYRGEWRDSSGRFLGAATLTKGLGGTESGDPLASRLGAGGDFTKYNFDIARIQEFNSQWLAVLRGSAQFSADPLFSAEQFALGGPDTVRGFSQAEALGDQAYNATLEVRYSPLTDNPDLFQTVFFLDHGAVTKKLPLPGEDGSEKLTGAGLGFRVNFDQTRVRLDLGFPISPSSNIRGTSPVIYGQVQTRF
jgi:hemolysin activation/secretion protein